MRAPLFLRVWWCKLVGHRMLTLATNSQVTFSIDICRRCGTMSAIRQGRPDTVITPDELHLLRRR